MEKYKLIATSTFGLESVVKRELEKLGVEGIKAQDGRVDFLGDARDIARANIWLRCSDRVLVNMGEFEAFSFEELFEKTKKIEWANLIPIDGKFTVTGKSVKSQLYSVPDCQAIVKKAIVEKLKLSYKVDWFEETGAEYKVQVSLLKDRVTLTIDTTGPSLHRRGYRENAGQAPLKETLAAALIDLSYYRPGKILADLCCGSGTIPIEAAMIARNIAPGINRKFACSKWEKISQEIWDEERKAAKDAVDHKIKVEIYGSDIDGGMIDLAIENAEKAGVADCITFTTAPIKRAEVEGDFGVCIMNPPYGERLATAKQAAEIYSQMGKIFSQNPTWSVYVLTSDEYFEKAYGKRADKKRKLFNGMIKTDYYQYF